MQKVVLALRQPNQVGKVWLDDLPTDVCSQIANFLAESSGFWYDYSSALYLSRVSELQRAAVKDGFSYRLDFRSLESASRRETLGESLVTEFASMLQYDVREIVASGPCAPVQNTWSLESSAPVKLSLFESFCDLEAISRMENLSSLTLDFKSPEHMKSFLRRLSVLNLRELKLVTRHTACLHKEFSDQPDDRPLLSNWFPLVERLDLCCEPCNWCWRDQPRSFLWHVIEQFTSLKDVAIREFVPEDVMEKLHQIDRVHLYAGAMSQLLEKIPERVVSVSTMGAESIRFARDSAIKKRHLEILTSFKRLEEFHCRISRGDEHRAVDTVANLGNLRVLNICFSAEHFFRADGMFLELVKAAPCLEKILIVDVQIMYSEVRDMLTVLGKRLQVYVDRRDIHPKFEEPGEDDWREFDFRATDPENEVAEYIETLRTVSLHNPSLRCFSLDVEFRWFRWCTDKQAVAALLPIFETTLQALQRRVPLLQVRYLHEVLQQLRNDNDQQNRVSA